MCDALLSILPHRLLGLDNGRVYPLGTSGDEIKRAFRMAALKYHPDRLPGSSEAERRQARDKFQQLAR